MQPYMVVFIDTKGPALLGRYDDKGVARRAWVHCKAGAAIAEAAGQVLEFKTGTPQKAESKLVSHALKVARETPPTQETAPVETSAPKVCAECHEQLPDHAIDCSENGPRPGSWSGDTRVRVKAAEVSVEIEEDDDVDPDDIEPEIEEDDDVDPDDIEPESDAVEDDDAPAPVIEPPPAPAQASGCEAKGCGLPLGVVRENTPKAFRCLCPGHRQTARFRVRDHECTQEEAVAWLRANERPPSRTSAELRAKKTPIAKVSKAAPKKPTKKPTKKPPRVTAAPSTLNAALDAMRRNAAVVEQLGGIAAAEQHVKTLAKIGGPAKVTELIRTALELAG